MRLYVVVLKFLSVKFKEYNKMALRSPKGSILYLLPILTPPFIILLLVSSYGVAVPFLDQWEVVLLLNKLAKGNLGLIDLWQQHNEHRIFFPKLIMLGLAWLSNWNIMLELYMNVFLAGLIMVFLWLLLRRCFNDCSFKTYWLLLLITSCLVFSSVQHENWTWGWQIQIFLSVLATVISVWGVTGWPGQCKGLLISATSAVVATYSFNNGLLAWIIVGIILFVQKNQRRWLFLAAWILACIITIITYYHGYEKPGHHPSITLFLKHPLDFIWYVFAYLGSPLGTKNTDISVVMGLFQLILFIIGTINIRKFHKEAFHRLLPWLALAFYSFLSAVVTGIGRLGFGVRKAMASRYTTISMLFIIATAVVVIYWISLYRRKNGTLTTKWVVIIYSVSTLIAISYILTYWKGVNSFKSHHKKLAIASAWLDDVDNAPEDVLQGLYPETGVVRERTHILQKLGIIKTIATRKNNGL